MQTLYKPSRRVYDTKVIEACHDGDDDHNAYHTAVEAGTAAFSTGVGAVASRYGLTAAQQALTSGVVSVFISEAEDYIAHKAEAAVNTIADAAEAIGDALESSGSGTAGSRPPSRSGSGYPGGYDPYADDHNNAQSGGN